MDFDSLAFVVGIVGLAAENEEFREQLLRTLATGEHVTRLFAKPVLERLARSRIALEKSLAGKPPPAFGLRLSLDGGSSLRLGLELDTRLLRLLAPSKSEP
jgi:hypothetical protein